jgi:hypothetical protein
MAHLSTRARWGEETQDGGGSHGGAAAWHVRPKSLQYLAEVNATDIGAKPGQSVVQQRDADREGSGNLVVLCARSSVRCAAVDSV